MKIAILGAGAMGCLIGTFLIKGGAEVNFVDAYEAHMKAIQEKGLEIKLQGKDEPEIIHPALATTNPEDVGVCDIVVLLVKGMATTAAVKGNSALFGKDTVIITLQNGLGNVDLLRELMPDKNIGFGVLKCSATMFAPGRTFGNPKFAEAHAGMYFYPLDPNTPYMDKFVEFHSILTKGGFIAELDPNTEAVVWDKLAANAVGNIPCALIQVAPQDFVSDDYGHIIHREIIREICEVANAKGIHMDYEEYWEKSCVPMIPGKPVTFRTYTSAIHDVSRKNVTEADFLNGAIVREGKKLGIPTPFNETVYCLIKVLEANYDNRYVPEK